MHNSTLAGSEACTKGAVVNHLHTVVNKRFTIVHPGTIQSSDYQDTRHHLQDTPNKLVFVKRIVHDIGARQNCEVRIQIVGSGAHILNPALGVYNGTFTSGKSITKYLHSVAAEGVTVVHHGAVQSAQHNVTRCHGERIVAINGVVTAMRSTHQHRKSDNIKAGISHHIFNEWCCLTPGCTVVVAVFNLDFRR